MGYSLTYRRPSFVSVSNSTWSSSSSAWSANKAASEILSGNTPNGVPEGLSFDKILAGKTCKPCTLRDFMNYLIYVERSAENLQFFLWYRNYLTRFAGLPTSEKTLSPVWLGDRAGKEQPKFSEKLEKQENMAPNAGVSPVAYPNFDMTLDLDAEEQSVEPKAAMATQWDTVSSTGASTRKSDFRQVAAEAYDNHDIVAPFTIQPYREEITRIVATYIAEGSPRELNISSKERADILRALAATTHPSAFGRIAATAETSLRRQSHPNFVRYAIQNGDNARITFAVTLGAITTLLGLIFAIMFTLSNLPRGYRVFSTIFFLLGITTLILGTRGICVILNAFHHCHLQPWELFDEEPDDTSVYEGKSKDSFDSFGSSNSYEDQPWVSKYERMSVLRKIFNREQRVNESALRTVHETMLIQALVPAVISTIILEAIFLSVPGGHLF